MITVSAVVVIGPHESPHRQIWRASETLPPNSSVLVLAQNALPLDTGDYEWFRDDLKYQVVCAPKDYETWSDYSRNAGGDPGANK